MGVGVWGLGFGAWGLGFGVWGLGFGVWGLGFGGRVWGLGYLGVRVTYPPPPNPYPLTNLTGSLDVEKGWGQFTVSVCPWELLDVEHFLEQLSACKEPLNPKP